MVEVMTLTDCTIIETKRASGLVVVVDGALSMGT